MSYNEKEERSTPQKEGQKREGSMRGHYELMTSDIALKEAERTRESVRERENTAREGERALQSSPLRFYNLKRGTAEKA